MIAVKVVGHALLCLRVSHFMSSWVDIVDLVQVSVLWGSATVTAFVL